MIIDADDDDNAIDVQHSVQHGHAADWERGYAKGYARALDQVKLMGCEGDDDGTCDCRICQVVQLLRTEVLPS